MILIGDVVAPDSQRDLYFSKKVYDSLANVNFETQA